MLHLSHTTSLFPPASHSLSHLFGSEIPRYKRADFEEDETSSVSSAPMDAPITGSSNASFGGSGPGGGGGGGGGGLPHVRYQSRRRNFWHRASPFEKFLIIVVSILALIVAILSIILHVRSSSPTLQVVHVTSGNGTQEPAAGSQYCLTPACVTVASTILSAMDLQASPCEDFYQYACGGWVKSNPLPDGKSLWGTFAKLWQENQLVMKNVLEDSSIEPKSQSERKARVYYLSCLDKNETVESLGSKPLLELLKKIGGWGISGEFDASNWDFQKNIEILHNEYNRGGFFSWGVGEDEKNSTRYILQIDQGELGLPSRDYYLNRTQEEDVLQAYLNYMTRVGVLLGGEENDTRRQMEEVIEFETSLASITVPAEDRRDDERLYHKKTLKELHELAPFLNWQKYFSYAFNQINRTISESEEIIVYSPEYLSNLSSIVTDYLSRDDGKRILSNYMGWSLAQSLTSCLSKSFRDASKILRKALIGSEGGESPWRYCVSDTNSVMGFALGAMFVREVFKGDSKNMAEQMIDEVRQAFKDNLPHLGWMDEETRQLAKEKADAITDMIGFPDFIMDPEKLDKKYEGLEFEEDEYFGNNIRVSQFSLRRNMQRLDKAANKSEWEMTPTTVNAYYTPTKNQIVFPAGILQAPFYDPSFPKSLNFGAMGVVMGHELTHAFDDQGREYDKSGNLHKWWKNSTIKSFESRARCFVDQYSSYEINGENINGKQTLGENIADNGGLKAAFNAYEDWMKNHPKELPLPGVNMTSRQLFFMGFAQVWCSASTPEAMHLQVLNDPHSPAKYRVIGTLSNSYEFAREFNCRDGSSMNPKKKCEVW